MNQAKAGRWLMVVACMVVAATLVAAIIVMGSPSLQREAKLDSRRVRDLQRIDQLVSGHFERAQTLPPDLDTLARQPGQRLSIADPVDGSPYTYEVTGDRTFRLCAVFVTDTASTLEDAGRWADDAWSHGVGHQCFERKAKENSGDD